MNCKYSFDKMSSSKDLSVLVLFISTNILYDLTFYTPFLLDLQDPSSVYTYIDYFET